ncbi:hypothetical protein I7I50_11814 [Histoplasma capsulatum G186AR]|uniref:Uncharacterized protein n=1 Tax=Ajellomyces capsulatus TaxID=5037 RepID=A0A8H7ZBP3_AJECA|nr:hypothetical protein I7I52_03052 [Histoplasma capsulatum]QSS70247.1 hypothetical protein I7I50_11814 [Histoplasma capsulatum G186AR]
MHTPRMWILINFHFVTVFFDISFLRLTYCACLRLLEEDVITGNVPSSNKPQITQKKMKIKALTTGGYGIKQGEKGFAKERVPHRASSQNKAKQDKTRQRSMAHKPQRRSFHRKINSNDDNDKNSRIPR